MNTRGLKKKPATSPLKPRNNKNKTKSKSKSKEKSKKFSPKDFLQALIDLQNTNCSTNKKGRNTTRDISSALTVATPALQKTISASKIRSKSSFSQYRKKINDKNKQPMTINLCAVITEQQNVQYTQKTARSSYQQQQNNKNKNKKSIQVQKYTKKVNENLCAIKIQRAWRNYQTYKMVHNIYLKQKRHRQNNSGLQQIKNAYGNTIPKLNINGNYVHIKIRTNQKQRTLKIKKQQTLKQTRRVEQRDKQKQKDWINSGTKKSPIQQFEFVSQQSLTDQYNQTHKLTIKHNTSEQQQIIIKKMKQTQARRLNQVINLIKQQGKNKDKQVLISQLIQKFQNNKKALEIDLSKQLDSFQTNSFRYQISQDLGNPSFLNNSKQPQQSSPQSSCNSKSNKSPSHVQNLLSSNLLSPSPFLQIKQYKSYKQSKQKNSQSKHIQSTNSQLEKKNARQDDQIMSINSLRNNTQSSNSAFFDYQNISDEIEQIKIFQQRLKTIKKQKFCKLEKIDDELDNQKITTLQALKKKQKIYDKYQKQKKQIQKNKKQFVFSLAKLKKSAIQYHKSALKLSSSQTKIRKSFSVGNTIIKQVIEDIKLVQFQAFQQQPELIQYIFRRQPNPKQPTNQQNNNQLKPLTTTPVLDLPSPNRNTQSQQQLLQKNNNTQVLKQYSEQIQQLIQKQLIQQFVLTAFLDENLFKYFKPYVQEIYEFKKINDNQIIQYVGRLKQFLPEEGVMMLRVNQKINPTTLQILKIIRDLDYQADQYQLIIPEDCFKKYRFTIQRKYQELNNTKGTTYQQILSKLKNNNQLASRVFEIEEQKRQKVKKYRNFERDLKIMYMKSVFNCINQYLIQLKSSNAFMNGRSSIGPGELSLALKQYNDTYTTALYYKLLKQVQNKLKSTINVKCSIPCFKNYHDIELFQKQVMKQIQLDGLQNQFKWVNYMDEVLEIWQDLCTSIIQKLFDEASQQIRTTLKFFQ